MNFRRSATAVALVTVLVSLPALAEDPVATLAQEYGQAALANARSPRAAASLYRLHALMDDVEDLNLLAKVYSSLLGRGSTNDEVRTLARQLYADLQRQRGNLTKSTALLEPLGYLSSFYVVGSFDNEGKDGCDTNFGPEAGISSLETAYPARDRELSWRPLQLTNPDGYVDLGAALRPNTEAVAYALTFLDAPQETVAELAVGTSGAFRLFVNGQRVLKSDRYNLPRPDQAKVAVRLRKGANQVLLKVCQETGPLGFYLRAERGPGGRITPKPAFYSSVPPLEKGPGPQPSVLPTLAERLAAEVRVRPNDPQLRGDYAAVLFATKAFEQTERKDQAEADKAVELAPQQSSLRLLAAELQKDDGNQRRTHLEAALSSDPKSAHARLALAEHELACEHPERALPILDALIEEQPAFANAHLARVRALMRLGSWPAAARALESSAKLLPYRPELVRAQARAAERMERREEAVALYRAALGLRYMDAESRRALASLLAELGRVDEAAEQYNALLSIEPFDNTSRLRLAELYAANERLDKAVALFEQAKTLAPAEPEVHERAGKALLFAGKNDEAMAFLRKSLALRPQNPQLKELLRSLEGDTAPLGTALVIDPKSLAKEASALGKEDAIQLVDYSYTRVQPSGLSARFQQLVIKVQTQRGVESFRSFPLTYSPDRQDVKVLKARITKADGSISEGFTENEQNMNEPWTGMYYDYRARVLSFPSLAPGDTLELWIRHEDTAQENLLSDYWGDVQQVQSTYPKLRFAYLVEMPSSRPLYWNQSRLPASVKSSQAPAGEGRTLYRFEASNVEKIIPEPLMPGWAEVATTLHVSTYQNWEQVGRYYWGLVRDQLTPNDELRRTLDEVLRGVDRKNQLAVVRAVYNFVVTNTRYVALEFGIHGYKPYRVDRVLARRFGDCKDKASLIHAMLTLAGVESRLVLLRMRHLGSIGAEPASLAAFNHAIAYVPSLGLYLDGTAEFHSSKELPSSDRVADILVIEPEGKSPFLTTPEAQAEETVSKLELSVALQADGSAQVKGKHLLSGQHAPNYRRAYQAQATRKSAFEQEWARSFPGLQVQKLEVSDPSRLDEDVKFDFKLSVPRYAEVLPGGLRFSLLGTTRSYTQAYAPLVERRHDLVMPQPWSSTFRYEYTLPAGFELAELPAEMTEESPFGKASFKARKEGALLVVDCAMSLSVARIKAADYPAFRAWLGRIDQALSRKLFIQGATGISAKR